MLSVILHPPHILEVTLQFQQTKFLPNHSCIPNLQATTSKQLEYMLVTDMPTSQSSSWRLLLLLVIMKNFNNKLGPSTTKVTNLTTLRRTWSIILLFWFLFFYLFLHKFCLIHAILYIRTQYLNVHPDI